MNDSVNDSRRAGAGDGAALVADGTVTRGEVTVTVGLDVPAGGSVAILGPNGAGKSTLLSAIAGLTPLTSGTIRVGGRDLERAGRLRERPERRRIALLDQKPRLFPHLSIARNIAFGPRSQGLSRAQTRAITAEWLDRIGFTARAAARPHELSGGQQQRVAIARAFAARPRVLLLDEPLAALDAETAPQIRRMLAAELERTGVTSLVVTHELADAWQWSEHCVVLDHGNVIDEASPAELSSRPRHPFTASLAGFGVLRGTWTGSALRVGRAELTGTVEDARVRAGTPAFGVIAPRAIAVRPAIDADGAGTPRGLAVRLAAVSARAGTVRLEPVAGPSAELDFARAVRVGGGRLPRVGDTYCFTPHEMRIMCCP